MKTNALSAVTVLFLTAVLARAQGEPRGVAEKLIGTWNVVAGEKEGKKEPPERIKNTTVEFTRDRVIVTTKDASKSYRASYKLGLKHKPYAIVMKAEAGKDKGEAAQGIFRLEGDLLTICYSLPGAPAPEQFRTTPGDRRLLFVLQKAK
jgi:uncharacterized protein (TIGR03067 family)